MDCFQSKMLLRMTEDFFPFFDSLVMNGAILALSLASLATAEQKTKQNKTDLVLEAV
jgi:hypothetical protein